MRNNIKKHVRPLRLKGLPAEMREQLREARSNKGWSQRDLGERLGLPQMHVSGIESGKIVPRFDTLLDYVRGLDHDLGLVPRSLGPAVLALIHEHTAGNKQGRYAARSLSTVMVEDPETGES